MPKTSKTELKNEATPIASGGSSPASTSAAAPPPKKRATGTKFPSGKKTDAKKKSASVGPKKSAVKRQSTASKPTEPSDADVRLRAYFIAERRVQLALQGDPAKDWLEARQQLVEEARGGKSSS